MPEVFNRRRSFSPFFGPHAAQVHDATTDLVRTSRFQFVDLAGSERLKEAHAPNANWKEGGEALNGLLTNYSLTMLSACVRGLVAARVG